MNKTILFSVFTVCLFLFNTSITAQTYQKGYAKTKGRLKSNGDVIHGEPLDSVYVQVKGGNAFYSKPDGMFKFPITSSSFILQNVEKDGYVLADPDILSKVYSYSDNQLTLSMEHRDTQSSDQLAVQRTLRKQAQDQLRIKERECDSLLELHKMSEEEHNKTVLSLYNKLDQDYDLIRDLARHYSKIDFDYADDFERQICLFIRNGEIAKADSMLNSTGNLTIKFLQWNLDREDLITKSYYKFVTCNLRHDNDSAAYFIGMRASIDTMNVDWQLEAADYISNYTTDYPTAQSLYDRALRIAIMRYGSQSTEAASALVSLVRFNERIGKYDIALGYAKQALSILESLPDQNNPIAQQCYENMAVAYDEMGDSLNALNYYTCSLNICRNLYGEQHKKTAVAYHNLGNYSFQASRYEEAMEYFNKSNDILRSLQDTLQECVADNYEGLSMVYSKYFSDYETANQYINRAIEIDTLLFDENHPYLANIYRNFGSLCIEMNHLNEALHYFEQAARIYTESYGESHLRVGNCYNGMGRTYNRMGDYDNALLYFEKALNNYSKTLDTNHSVFIVLYNNIGEVYFGKKNYELSSSYHIKALNIALATCGEFNHKTATCYDNLGQDYHEMGEFDRALENAMKALEIRTVLFKDNDNIELATSYSNIANIYQKHGDLDLAIQYMKQCGQILDNIFKGEANYYNAVFKYNLCHLYRKQSDLPHAIECAEESIAILRQLAQENELREDHPIFQVVQNAIDEMKTELNGQ